MQTSAQAKQESEDMPRLQHLKSIEASMVQKFKDADIAKMDAPEDHYKMEFEEKNKGKHMCTFPFPYMNGYLHLGHGFTISKCEFQSRYQRQIGKRTLFPFAFHCTGMPIQAAANRLKREINLGKTCSNQPTPEELKALEKANPKYQKPDLTQYEILLQLGFSEEQIPAFTDPLHWIDFFPPIGMKDLQDFGLFTDWRRSFITTDANPFFDSYVRWQFTTLKEKNKVKHGKRYTIFSELDNQPCADHDRAKGEGVAPQEYTGIKIELLDKPHQFEQWADKKIYLIAATLRPETMYGQTNCFILPEGDYGLYEMKGDEFFVMSHRAAQNFAWQEMTKEDTKYPQLASVKGQDIIGKRLKTPLAPFEHVFALPMPTISMGKGTGIVTSVPSDSPDDYAMLYDLQTKKGLREKYGVEEEHCVPFEPIPIIEIPGLGNMAAKSEYERLKIQSHKDTDKLKQAKEVCYQKGFNDGVMIVGEGQGKLVQEAKPIIKEMMVNAGQAVIYYEPESEVISRSEDKCCVALKFQWLLDYGEDSWKEVVKKHIMNEEIFNTYNPQTRVEFEAIVEWLKEWGCSRTAGLGSQLPWDDQFVIESLSDSTIYMAYYTIAHFLQQGSLKGEAGSSLGIKPEDMTRGAWDYIFLGKEYSSEAIPNISEETLKKMRCEFEYWYPMDMRVSGKDLIRNHLTMSLYNHAAIWSDNLKQGMPRSYFCNGYLNLDNKKMSKSTGNFLTLRQCMNKYGVEATRITIADAGDGLDDANFDGQVANSAIMKLFNLEEWIKKHAVSGTYEEKPLSFWDKIIQNELSIILKKVKHAYDDMKFKIVIKLALNEMLSLKENWLIANGSEQPNPAVMNQLIETMLIMLNPIVPHFCQHVWESVMVPALKSNGKNPSELLISQGWPVEQVAAEDSLALSGQYKYLQAVKSDIRIAHQKAMSGGKKAKKNKGAEATESPSKSNAVLLVGTSFPEYKKIVLDLLTQFEFQEYKLQPEHIGKIKEAFPDKKANGLAMSFAQFVLADAKVIGHEAAFATTMPFDEEETLRINQEFLFENMPTITNVMVLKVDSEEAKAVPESANALANAVPGKPQPHFF